MPRPWPLILSFLWLAPAARAEEWKFDVVALKSGATFPGLIVAEDRETITFKFVVRKPGVPTAVIDTVFSKDEVDLPKLKRLSDDQRAELAKRLEQLDRGGHREQARIKELPLQTIRFNGGDGWRYSTEFFEFETNVREDLARQIAVRLEDVFRAYHERLKGTHRPKQATRIVLFRTGEEYLKAIQDLKINILNPAFYEPNKNRIMAASTLDQHADELDKLKKKHDGLLQELEEQEKKLRRHYNGQPPKAMLAQLWQVRRSIASVNAENQDAFEQMKRPLLAMVYHEAFHAYLDNFVWPAAKTAVPRWLNEGLAQIFETAIVEAGELRVGHVHRERLEKVQEAIREKNLVPLKDLLTAGEKPFAVHDFGEKQIADRYFLTAWALAYYLAFDRKLLGSEALERYIAALTRGNEPLGSFHDLVDQRLSEFEAAFHQFLERLKPDGTLQPREMR